MKLLIGMLIVKHHSDKMHVYGGFAREAMRAQINCKKTLKVFEEVGRTVFPKDIIVMICKYCWITRFDDLSWFIDPVKNMNDVDVLLSRQDTHSFEYGVKTLRRDLNQRLSKYHYSSPVRKRGTSHEFDANCRRMGETSHGAGDFHHYTVTFQKKGWEWDKRIRLDVVFFIKEDWLDASVNSLLMSYDSKSQEFIFKTRKPNIVNLSTVEEDIEKNQFHSYSYPFDETDPDGLYQENLQRRWDRLEQRGWTWANKESQ